MGRWDQYEGDDYRLPDGMTRTGYDADEQVYYYVDQDGKEWKGAPGNRYGRLRPVITDIRCLTGNNDRNIAPQPKGDKDILEMCASPDEETSFASKFVSNYIQPLRRTMRAATMKAESTEKDEKADNSEKDTTADLPAGPKLQRRATMSQRVTGLFRRGTVDSDQQKLVDVDEKDEESTGKDAEQKKLAARRKRAERRATMPS